MCRTILYTYHIRQNSYNDEHLYCGKQRPEMYLSHEVRIGISSFHNFCPDSELERGLARLADDIESGSFNTVSSHYDRACGDYLFVQAEKI
jgi:hypothetical protein